MSWLKTKIAVLKVKFMELFERKQTICVPISRSWLEAVACVVRLDRTAT